MLGEESPRELPRQAALGSRRILPAGRRLGLLLALSLAGCAGVQEVTGVATQQDILQIRQDVAELHAAKVRIQVIGEREGLAHDIVQMIEECERLTAGNTGLTLIVAFNYGSRQEIVRAARLVAAEVAAGRLAPESVGPGHLAEALYLPGMPDPDLLIRTSGEQRLSNFLLWQLAYTEFVFVEEHWPDFNRDIFARAIGAFQQRERRFGGITARAL